MSIVMLDCAGRVKLPKGIISSLKLYPGDDLAIDLLGNGTIIIKKPAISLKIKENPD
ncbi:MAG: hypothetical protein ACP5OU_09995 [Methanothrix sp.]